MFYCYTRLKIHFCTSDQILTYSISTLVLLLKARSNGSNMLVKHYPTLLGGIGWCLISVGLCWMLECSNESMQYHPTMLNFSTRHEMMAYFWPLARTKMLDDVGWKGWTKSNLIQHRSTLSNMFDCRVQMGQAYVASNNVWCLTNMFVPFERTCTTNLALITRATRREPESSFTFQSIYIDLS